MSSSDSYGPEPTPDTDHGSPSTPSSGGATGSDPKGTVTSGGKKKGFFYYALYPYAKLAELRRYVRAVHQGTEVPLAGVFFWPARALLWFFHASVVVGPILYTALALAIRPFGADDKKQFPVQGLESKSCFPLAEQEGNQAIGENGPQNIRDAFEQNDLDFFEDLDGPQLRAKSTTGQLEPIGGGDVIDPEPPVDYVPSRSDLDQDAPPNLISDSAATIIVTNQELVFRNGKVILEAEVVDSMNLAGNNPLNGTFEPGQKVQIATTYRVSGAGDKWFIEDGSRVCGQGASGNPLPREAEGVFGAPLPAAPFTNSQGQPVNDARPASAPVIGYAVFVVDVRPTGDENVIGVIPHQQGGLVPITNFDGSSSPLNKQNEKAIVRWDARALDTPVYAKPGTLEVDPTRPIDPASRLPQDGRIVTYGDQLLFGAYRWDREDRSTWANRTFEDMHNELADRGVTRLNYGVAENRQRWDHVQLASRFSGTATVRNGRVTAIDLGANSPSQGLSLGL